MAIVARPFEPKDADAYFDIRSATYRNGVPFSAEDRLVNSGRAFVGEVDGRVAGVANVHNYEVTRGAATLASAGIAAVAVNPAERRCGVGSALLSWLVRNAREEGFPLSSLYPFREPFYRKFGYEVCGKRIHLVCPSPRLPKLESDLPVQKIVPKDWNLLRPCYETFAHDRSGFHIRDEVRWAQVLGAKDFPATYAFGDPVEAYAIVVHKFDFWEGQRVAEIAWSSGSGYRAIISWFHGLAVNKTYLDWHEPSDSPFLAAYLDQGVEVKIDRPIMYRVADVPSALRHLKPHDTGEFSVSIQDSLIPENSGPWRVSYSPTGVAVEKTDRAELEMHICQFSSAFMGEPSLTDLARNGLISVRERAALTAASGLLSASPVSGWDFF